MLTYNWFLWSKLNFQDHYSGLQCHMILQKSFKYTDLLFKKHFWLLSILKTVELLHIFVKTDIFPGLIWVESSEEPHLFQFFFFKVLFLTLLKHKHTIIRLQIFKKHAKLTYLFIWKTMLQSVILSWKHAFRAEMSVSVLVCVTRPLPVHPILFRHPGFPVGGKHSVFHVIHRHLLVSLIWQVKSEEERPGEKTLSSILNLDCNT